MARIRTVKPEFFKHRELASCSPHARLLAIALLQQSDAEGRLEWIDLSIHGEVFPWETSVNVRALLGELSGIGWVEHYTHGGREYVSIPNFRKHQRLTGKEAALRSKLPDSGDVPGEAPGCFPVQYPDVQGTGEQGNRGTGSPKGPHRGLFDAAEEEAPKASRTRKSKTHPDAPALFAHFKAEFAATQGKPTSKTLGTFAKAAGPRLEEHGLDACKAVASWAMRSPHSRAKHLRSEGFLSGETLWRPSKFEGYLDLARADVGPSGSVRAVYATFLDWLNDPAHKAARTERVCAMVDEAEVSTVWDYDAMIDKMARWTAETTVPDELRAEARAYFARWKGE